MFWDWFSKPWAAWRSRALQRKAIQFKERVWSKTAARAASLVLRVGRSCCTVDAGGKVGRGEFVGSPGRKRKEVA